MASSHHPHASFHRSHVKRTTSKAARILPVSKNSTPTNMIPLGKSDENLVFESMDDDDMPSSFLQFCAMCEKQIIIPNNTILYCSESCRRKDARVHDSNPSLSLLNPHPLSLTYEPAEADSTIRTILPRKLPTPRTLDSRIPPLAHNGKADIDPTEWKPADREGANKERSYEGRATTWKPKLVHRPSSEAYGYLSQFHRSAPAASPRSTIPVRSTPSLSHTPTTSSGSGDSMASTPFEVGLSPPEVYPDSGPAVSAEMKNSGLDSSIMSAAQDVKRGSLEDKILQSTLHAELHYDKKKIPNSDGSAVGSLKRLLGKESLDNSTSIAM